MGEPALAGTPRLLLAVFLLTLLLPVFFYIGELRLSPYRVFLLLAFVPFLMRWAAGGAGRLVPGDVLIGLQCVWIGVAIVANHGTTRIPYAGITVLEAFGGYLAGRVLIRSAADYLTFFRYFTVGLAVLLPFVIVEMLTARLIISEALDGMFSTFPKVWSTEKRLGFYRAQAVFEHTILWGVFASLAVANLFYLYRASLVKSVLFSGFATGVTFTSLSSAPLLSVILQFGMIGWGWVTRNAWWTLVILAAIAYVAVDLASNRTPITILISYTFNPVSGWMRIHIWNFGSAEVWRNPVFGIGLKDWIRPAWLYSASVDNFWLVVAMRYGIPGFLLLVLGIASNLFGIMRQDLPAHLLNYRLAYVIAAAGLFMTLATVHVWGANAVLMMFYIGAGVWMFNGTAEAREGTPDAGPAEAAAGRARLPYRRSRAEPPDEGGEPVEQNARERRGLTRGARAIRERRRGAYGRDRT